MPSSSGASPCLAPALAAAAVYLAAGAATACCWRWPFNVVVLYLTLGFRQFSHYFTDIRDALERGDEDQARRLLGQWRHLDASELPRTELLRHVLEHSLLAAHRHVFGVFFCFIVLSALGLGPAGAVVYRMAEFASRYWAFKSRTLDAPANERLMRLVAAPVRADRPRAGAADGLRLRRGRQLRGGRQRLAPRRRACGCITTRASCSRRRPAPSACSSAARPRPASRPTARRPSTAAAIRHGCRRVGLDARRAAAGGPPAERGRPGLALGDACGCCWRRCSRWPTCSAEHGRPRLLGSESPPLTTAGAPARRRSRRRCASATALISPRSTAAITPQPGSWRCVQL